MLTFNKNVICYFKLTVLKDACVLEVNRFTCNMDTVSGLKSAPSLYALLSYCLSLTRSPHHCLQGVIRSSSWLAVAGKKALKDHFSFQACKPSFL